MDAKRCKSLERIDALTALGRYWAALAIADQGWPDKAPFLRRFAFLSLKLNRLQDAEKAARKAVRLDPYSTWGWNLLRLILNDTVSSGTDAEEAFRSSLLRDPNGSRILCRYVFYLHESDRTTEAEDLLRRALLLKPDEPELHLHIGLLHYHGARFQEALACCNHALARSPDFSAAYVLLGHLKEQCGHFSEAEDAFNTVLRLNPANSWVKDHLARIRPRAAADRYAQAQLMRIMDLRAGRPVTPPMDTGLPNVRDHLKESGPYPTTRTLMAVAVALYIGGMIFFTIYAKYVVGTGGRSQHPFGDSIPWAVMLGMPR